VESVRDDCSLTVEGVVPGSRLLRVDDFELASRNTGGGIAYRTCADILLHSGLMPDSYGGMEGAVRAEMNVNNAALSQSGGGGGGGASRLSSTIRQSMSSNPFRGNGSLRNSKVVTVVFAVPFTRGTSV
jgi:hypothetical protein